MNDLTSADFLNLWERGVCLHPVDRSLLALSLANPETTYDRLADLPLGARNRALAELRSSCFGPGLEGWTTCEQCGEKLEFRFDARTLAAAAQSNTPTVEMGGHTFRLPTSRDLARVSRETDSRTAAARLLDACRLGVGNAPPWSDAELKEAGERLAEADPLAETRLTLDCPACGRRWDETLDVGAFLWAEVEARAKRLLLEVHTLASAYGWSEGEILALSEARRAYYIEAARA